MAINYNNIKQELVVFLRNQDIFSTILRGVTTDTHTETLAGDGSATISRTNVKNVRSVEVDATPLVFGTDYTVDYGNGNENAVITFSSNQTGDLEVSYDYGTDKIYPDFPRDDLNIDSYPRIAVDILNVPSDAFGIGGEDFISDVTFTVVVYDDNGTDIDSYLSTIRSAFIDSAKDFFFLRFIKPILTGPMISDPEKTHEIMQRNLDFTSMFNTERAS